VLFVVYPVLPIFVGTSLIIDFEIYPEFRYLLKNIGRSLYSLHCRINLLVVRKVGPIFPNDFRLCIRNEEFKLFRNSFLPYEKPIENCKSGYVIAPTPHPHFKSETHINWTERMEELNCEAKR
jgi:hypothetical protein